jgi:hypothetical protein
MPPALCFAGTAMPSKPCFAGTVGFHLPYVQELHFLQHPAMKELVQPPSPLYSMSHLLRDLQQRIDALTTVD